MSSQIYDLGYQRYTGVRHGRAHSVRTLWWFSVRAAYGLGRGEQARRMPALVAIFVFLPALVQIGIASAMGMTNFISYGNYLEFSALAIALFVASQAPELIVNDKQNGTLSLYLSRPIRASDYALAKLAALTTATVLLTLGPMMVMFVAKVFLPPEPWAAFKAEWTKLLPIIGGSLIISLFFASVALALSSFAIKRAFATASVIAFFLLTPAVYAVAQSVTTGAIRRWSVLLNPVLVVSGLSKWLFELEASRRSAVGRADLPGTAYLWVVIGAIAVSTFVLLSRYRRNEA